MKAILTAFGLTIITSFIEAFGLYNIRMGGLHHTALASLIYGLGVVPMLSKTMAYEGIGLVNFFWNVLSTLFGFVIGIYVFNEKIRYLQVIGVILSLLGLVLILVPWSTV
jgi:multidrug transporter EmrE-like cation transporter